MPCLPNWIPRRKKSAAPVTPTKWWKISENKFSIPFHRHPLRCRNEAKDTQTPQHSATHSTPPLSFLEIAIFSGCMPSMRSKVSWYSSKIFQLLTGHGHWRQPRHHHRADGSLSWREGGSENRKPITNSWWLLQLNWPGRARGSKDVDFLCSLIRERSGRFFGRSSAAGEWGKCQ